MGALVPLVAGAALTGAAGALLTPASTYLDDFVRRNVLKPRPFRDMKISGLPKDLTVGDFGRFQDIANTYALKGARGLNDEQIRTANLLFPLEQARQNAAAGRAVASAQVASGLRENEARTAGAVNTDYLRATGDDTRETNAQLFDFNRTDKNDDVARKIALARGVYQPVLDQYRGVVESTGKNFLESTERMQRAELADRAAQRALGQEPMNKIVGLIRNLAPLYMAISG